jgi:hypothetical protein
LWIASIHHSLTLRIVCQLDGSTLWRPSQSFTLVHAQTVNRHLNKRWDVDSWTWLQILHLPQFCHPLLSSLSVVQTLFWITNQSKVLHFGGDVKGDLVCPKNCIDYAILDE